MLFITPDYTRQHVLVIDPMSIRNYLCLHRYNVFLRWFDHLRLSTLDKCCLFSTFLLLYLACGFCFVHLILWKINLKFYVSVAIATFIFMMIGISLWNYKTNRLYQVRSISIVYSNYQILLTRRRALLDALLLRNCQHDIRIKRDLNNPLDFY